MDQIVPAPTKVLFVDDDLEVLRTVQRRFKAIYNLEVAASGPEGLEAVTRHGPFAVVVSDYRMPGMDGIEFLTRIKEIAPDTVRIMLTGQPDLDLAIKAVNEGHVYRFLTKPCPNDILARAIEDGLRHYQLVLAERELHGLRRWRKSLEELVLAFAALIETRDPYTAGHQQRVTKLACAIARELGLPESRTESIRLAAMIHDIGKIYVPAEFLNRPGRLTKVEFDVIRLHPQVGYDVLKTVDFEFSVSRIVQQHHEVLDGSGYPLGLSGDDILFESRILTVADVVEAMNSHRPYRPSLGLTAALTEIESHQGRRYDPAAVSACLKLAAADETLFQAQA
ncbi:MAG: HD domain-containing phosphohydrolase [Thermodesulfobacteriota bacterium]